MIVIRRVSPFRVAMESQRIGLGGLQKFLDTSKGSSEKIRGGGGGPKICILQNQLERGGGS